MAPIKIARHAVEVRTACDAVRKSGSANTVGLVPTMGALHAGHVALARAARRRTSFVVASIFVNPTQFGPTEDLSRYPRDLDGDMVKLASAGVDLVFAPEAGEIYPDGDQTRVRVDELSVPLCGAVRPGHFEGVATVVAKLFNIIGPCVALFGKKDYQQLLVVKRMVRDLFLPVEIEGHPIVREADGMAMSSRNAYLSPEERLRALSIVRGLGTAARLFAKGERRPRELERVARELIEKVASSVDYVELRDAETLAPFVDTVGDRALLAVACRIGTTRLIDNLILGEDPPPAV